MPSASTSQGSALHHLGVAQTPEELTYLLSQNSVDPHHSISLRGWQIYMCAERLRCNFRVLTTDTDGPNDVYSTGSHCHATGKREEMEPSTNEMSSEFDFLLRIHRVNPAFYQHFSTCSSLEEIAAKVRHEKHTFLHSAYRYRQDKLRYLCKVAGSRECYYHFYALWDEDNRSYQLFESQERHSHEPIAPRSSRQKRLATRK